MKYTKMLGLLSVAAAALMAFVGTASATVTSPAGTPYAGNIKATSTNTALDGDVDITCANSTMELDPSSAGATSGEVDVLTFTNCSRSVTVTALGVSSIASNGGVIMTGARITVQTTILGFPVHCIYATNNTLVGTLTENVSPPVIHVISPPMPRVPTSNLCTEEFVWTGTYTVNTPASAITVD